METMEAAVQPIAADRVAGHRTKREIMLAIIPEIRPERLSMRREMPLMRPGTTRTQPEEEWQIARMVTDVGWPFTHNFFNDQKRPTTWIKTKAKHG
jgi:hypothetical protein